MRNDRNENENPRVESSRVEKTNRSGHHFRKRLGSSPRRDKNARADLIDGATESLDGFDLIVPDAGTTNPI